MDWVNSIRSPGLTVFFQYITWLGYRDFLFLFIPFCYWFFDRKIFGIFTLFVFIGALSNIYFKDLFQDSRPDISLNIDPWATSTELSYGFPSGHAQLAVIIWGYLFQQTKNNYLKNFFIFLIVSICLSRVYLGVHDISDVIGGIIFGLISLGLLNYLFSNNGKWLRNQSHTMHFIIYIIILIFTYFVWPIEENRVVVAGLGALIITFWIGYTLDKSYFFFKKPKNLMLKSLISVIATIGFIQLNSSIERIFSFIQINQNIETTVSSILLGIYISFIVPLILNFLSNKKN